MTMDQVCANCGRLLEDHDFNGMDTAMCAPMPFSPIADPAHSDLYAALHRIAVLANAGAFTVETDEAGHALAEADRVCARWSDRITATPNAWQPIETAPQNGDDILASHVNPSCVMVVSWDEVPDHPDHPWLSDGDLRYHREAFTHWQPLPEPPEPGK